MNFTDRQTQYPNRVKLKKITDETDGTIYDVERAEGNIMQQGTPLNAANLNAISSDLEAKLKGSRLIGEIKNGTGNIIADWDGSLSTGNRFIANITAQFLGNRNWRITGSGKPYTARDWKEFHYGFSPINIAKTLGLADIFFNTVFSEQPVKCSGNWSTRNVTTGLPMATQNMGYGNCIEITDRQINNNNYGIVFARIYSDAGSVGGWMDYAILDPNFVFQFEFNLKANMD